VAWTVADLQGQARPRRSDVEHALRLRTPEAVRVA
jgi:predicted ATPase with chaperone activity